MNYNTPMYPPPFRINATHNFCKSLFIYLISQLFLLLPFEASGFLYFLFTFLFFSFIFWPNPFSFTPLPFLDNVQSCLDLYCKEGKSWPCHGGSGIHEGYEFPRKNHVVVDVFCNLIMPPHYPLWVILWPWMIIHL